MKATGIVRRVDELGRIVVPIELRRNLGIDIKDPIEIFVDGDYIMLKKFVSHKACQITGDVSNDNMTLADGKLVLSRDSAEKLIKEINSKLEG